MIETINASPGRTRITALPGAGLWPEAAGPGPRASKGIRRRGAQAAVAVEGGSGEVATAEAVVVGAARGAEGSAAVEGTATVAEEARALVSGGLAGSVAGPAVSLAVGSAAAN